MHLLPPLLGVFRWFSHRVFSVFICSQWFKNNWVWLREIPHSFCGNDDLTVGCLNINSPNKVVSCFQNTLPASLQLQLPPPLPPSTSVHLFLTYYLKSILLTSDRFPIDYDYDYD